jgi:RimJ/RimL family protein N-acetyltransferase
MKVKLSDFKEQDITKEYLGWLSNQSLMRFSRQQSIIHNEVTALRYLNELREEGGRLLKIVVLDKYGGDICIGTLSVRNAGLGISDLGLMIGSNEYRGQGYGFAAWEMGIELVWQLNESKQITAGTRANNLAMMRIIEKSGMTYQESRIEENDLINYYYLERSF